MAFKRMRDNTNTGTTVTHGQCIFQVKIRYTVGSSTVMSSETAKASRSGRCAKEAERTTYRLTASTLRAIRK